MTNKEIIAVVTAAEEGKQIERLPKGSSVPWVDDPDPTWNFQFYLYRVKPEPREIWLVSGIPFTCKHEAVAYAETYNKAAPIHYREVL